MPGGELEGLPGGLGEPGGELDGLPDGLGTLGLLLGLLGGLLGELDGKLGMLGVCGFDDELLDEQPTSISNDMTVSNLTILIPWSRRDALNIRQPT